MRNARKPVLLLIVLIGIYMSCGASLSYGSISLSVDNTFIDFGSVERGETQELAEKGYYHNEITCSSTNNQTWYLKAQAIRPLQSGMRVVPIENFQWVAVSTGKGTGVINGHVDVPHPFSLNTDIIYTSGPNDNSGEEIKLKFKYRVTVPKNTVAGTYNASVRLIMIEIL